MSNYAGLSDVELLTDLLECADVQFSSRVTYSQPSSCTNNTGIQVFAFPSAAAHLNANESTAEGQPQSGSGSGSAASTGAAVPLQTAAWGMLGVVFAGGLVLL